MHADHESHRDEVVRYWIILTIAIFTAWLEFWGAHESSSRALATDAWHVVSDSASIVASLIVAYLVRGHANHHRTTRIRAWGARLSALLLTLAAVRVAADVMERLTDPPAVAGDTMLAIAAIGMACNGLQLVVLLGGVGRWLHLWSCPCATHRSMKRHILSDMALSGAVVFGSIGVILTGSRWLDPALAIIAVCWIIHLAFDLFMHPAGNGDGHAH